MIGNAEIDVDIPNFDPKRHYSSEFELFPFFESVNDGYLSYFKKQALVGRDNVVKQINATINDRGKDKYQPIVLSTSRGMGKTFLMKCVGSQNVKEGFECDLIRDALTYGRVLSFDFAGAAAETAISSQEDIKTFFTRLMVFFLCRMFDGTEVDGMHFQEAEFSGITTFLGNHGKFIDWKRKCLQLGVDRMINEYIRLTNIAFHVDCKSPPVFLLDEIQGLCKPTTVQSKFQGNQIVYHSYLSLLLTQLAGKHKPVCICTGTNNGNIIQITEMSRIIPQIVSLSTFFNEDEYNLFWEQMTAYRNSFSRIIVEMEGDKDLIESLVFASYQIPRLLYLAHDTWFEKRAAKLVENKEYFLQNYEEVAKKYYGEMAGLLSNPKFTAEKISCIIMACGVHWKVQVNSEVPGTDIVWNDLIQLSIIFPYTKGYYLFPFHLIWSMASYTSPGGISYDIAEKKKDIETICEKRINNFSMKNLFFSYDDLGQKSLYEIGIYYEDLIVSSLAVKYYLKSLVKKKPVLSLLEIYDIDSGDPRDNDRKEHQILANFNVDFSAGIDLPEQEVFANANNLPKAVIHNKNVHQAHHDILLPAISNDSQINIAVQCKASFDLKGKSTIDSQLQISKQNTDPMHQLFWFYLGEESRESNYGRKVAFLNGSGCCNGLSLNLFEMFKKLKSKKNSQ